MKSLLFAALLLGACIGARAEGDVDESAVVVLTDDNFDATISGAKFALVSLTGRQTPRSGGTGTIARSVHVLTPPWSHPAAGGVLCTVVRTLQGE
jgi:hypothetical protein